MVFVLWMLACDGRDRPRPPKADPTSGATLEERGTRTCPDPSLRDEARFDVLELPGPAGPARFWGAGVTLGDFDGDSHLDLVLPGPEALRLWWGDGAGGLAEDPSVFPPLDGELLAAAGAADPDADGDLDLLVTRYGTTDTWLENVGGAFVDATDVAGVGGPGGTYSQGVSFEDLDQDGDLDLLVAGHGYFEESDTNVRARGPTTPSRLHANLGDGTFEDQSHRLPEPLKDAYTFVPGISDLDQDGLADLFFVNDFPMYRPSQAAFTRDGAFDVVSPAVGLNVPLAAMGLAIADLNDDGFDDFVVPAWKSMAWLLSVPEAHLWVTATQALGVKRGDGQHVGWAAEAGDLDADGDVEVVVIFGFLESPPFTALDQPDAVYERDEDGLYPDTAPEWGLDDPGAGRGVALGDLNEDGFPDVVVPDLRGPTRVHLSRCGEAAWLEVRLRGPAPNLDGVGAVVSVEAGGEVQRRRLRAGGTSYLSQGPIEAHFGLGDAGEVDLEVLWPDGARSTFQGVRTRQRVEVVR